MIPRSYSRGLALQLNFMQHALYGGENAMAAFPIWFYLDLQTR
jgi:hypothetical protein